MFVLNRYLIGFQMMNLYIFNDVMKCSNALHKTVAKKFKLLIVAYDKADGIQHSIW